MKKLLLILTLVILGSTLYAQTPQAINYQGVARDNGGNILANQSVALRLSILSGSAGGTVVYSETHSKTTDGFGLFALQIGQGTPMLGTFSTIGWGTNTYYLKVEIDPAGGSNYQLVGTNQYVSVPYALYAKNSGYEGFQFYFADIDGDGRGDKHNAYFGPIALPHYISDSTDNNDLVFGLGTPPANCVNLPDLMCAGSPAYCNELISFNPRTTSYYDDYPINGETSSNQYRSYLQRENIMAIVYAVTKTSCYTQILRTGNSAPLGLGDMSEANGAIPGTSIGDPGHPEGTHENGLDIDVGYYQISGSDNHLRPICNTILNNVNQYHCVEPPNNVDIYRTAFFIACLAEHPKLRVVAVDGQIGPLILQKLTEFEQAGWITSSHKNIVVSKLAFETNNNGLGWYYFLYPRIYISFSE